MNTEKFNDLVKRYKSGKATPQEIAALEAFLEKNSKADSFAQLQEGERNALHDEMLAHITRKISESRRRQIFIPSGWLKVAAAYRNNTIKRKQIIYIAIFRCIVKYVKVLRCF